jgi:hypothetical protein
MFFQSTGRKCCVFAFCPPVHNSLWKNTMVVILKCYIQTLNFVGHLSNSWSRVCLEKLIVTAYIVSKFPALRGIRRFIVLTGAHH